MRRLIFSLICSSGKAAKVLKPTGVGINFLPNQDRLARRVVDESAPARKSTSITRSPSGRDCMMMIALHWLLARFRRLSYSSPQLQVSRRQENYAAAVPFATAIGADMPNTHL